MDDCLDCLDLPIRELANVEELDYYSSLDVHSILVEGLLLLLNVGNLGILVVLVFLVPIRLEGIDCYFGCYFCF